MTTRFPQVKLNGHEYSNPILVSVARLREALAGKEEIALIDVREEGVHSRDGHIILSASLPLSHIELRAAALIPRPGVPVVVYDGGDHKLAFRAARRLLQLGYSDVSVLEGGVAAWKQAGHEVYTGVSVLSKAFGEFVEHVYETPRLSAAEVKSYLDREKNVLILDSRTLEEFETFSIPGAFACPSAELVYRAHDLIKSPETLVVVNCAGRTRSIIGAQALINAGLPNKVVALENGTMAWLGEGYGLDHGVRRFAAKPSAEGLARARQAAQRLASRFGVRSIDRETLARFQAESGERSLYLLDVRTREEFEAGHLPGSRWAEGGQLVQGLQKWVGIRNARITLIDDSDGVRAAITASWLIQIGWGDVYVYTSGLNGELEAGALETGPAPLPVLGDPGDAASLSAENLKVLVDHDEVTVLDLASSSDYARGHIPGAHFVIRSRLLENAPGLPGETPIVLTSPDGVLARFAAAELANVSHRKVIVLKDGTNAWRAAGLPLADGRSSLHHPAEDVWLSPYQADGNRQAAFQQYLDWEIGLIEQLRRDDTVSFRTFPVSGETHPASGENHGAGAA